MRRKLKKKRVELKNRKGNFSGIFQGYGTKKVNKGQQLVTTLLIKEVKDLKTGTTLTDHCWIYSPKLSALENLEKGVRIMFDASIQTYEKGHTQKRIDFTFRQFTNVRVG